MSKTGLCVIGLNVKDRTVCLMELNVRGRTLSLSLSSRAYYQKQDQPLTTSPVVNNERQTLVIKTHCQLVYMSLIAPWVVFPNNPKLAASQRTDTERVWE